MDKDLFGIIEDMEQRGVFHQGKTDLGVVEMLDTIFLENATIEEVVIGNHLKSFFWPWPEKWDSEGVRIKHNSNQIGFTLLYPYGEERYILPDLFNAYHWLEQRTKFSACMGWVYTSPGEYYNPMLVSLTFYTVICGNQVQILWNVDDSTR